MIDGLTLDFTGARLAARLAWRPDDRLWTRLHAARGLRALLDAARSAAVGNYVSGLAAQAGSADVDAAFRAQWRARVTEVAGWAPVAWRAAVQWTAHLADVTAAAHLWTQAPLPWMQADPVLMRYAAGQSAGTRRALLVSGPLAPLGRALLAHAAVASAIDRGAAGVPGRRRTQPGQRGQAADGAADHAAELPPALAAWIAHWQSLWPPTSLAFDAEQRADLHALVDDVLTHRRRFAQLPPADTVAARAAFAARTLARLRTDPSRPVALFAFLVVLALDLERLRAECQTQAFDASRRAAT
jgi:hypothetical protein